MHHCSLNHINSKTLHHLHRALQPQLIHHFSLPICHLVNLSLASNSFRPIQLEMVETQDPTEDQENIETWCSACSGKLNLKCQMQHSMSSNINWLFLVLDNIDLSRMLATHAMQSNTQTRVIWWAKDAGSLHWYLCPMDSGWEWMVGRRAWWWQGLSHLEDDDNENDQHQWYCSNKF